MSEVKEARHIVDVQEDATSLTIIMEKNPPEPEEETAPEVEEAEEAGEAGEAEEDEPARGNAKVLSHRSIQAEARALEQDNLVELAFSSELPVERDGYMEVLDHSEGSADLTRLNNGAPLLLNHKTDDQIGVVESARIDKDKVGRAVVRFSKSERAQEIYRDVKDGIRRLTSIGYHVLKTVRERAEEGLDTLRVTRFLPLELSVVPVPADPSVGVGRGVAVEQPQQKEKIIMSEVVQERETPNVEVIAENTRNAELKRSKELTGLGARYNCMDDAYNAIQDGKTAGEFSRWILDNHLKNEPTKQDTGEIGLTDKEAKDFSLLRAVRSYCETGRVSGFEGEVSEAAAKRYGRPNPGLIIPTDVLAKSSFAKRDVSTAVGGAGAVATDLLGTNFIDALRNKSVVQQTGATVLNGLVGDVAIPRLATNATGYWLTDETTAITESQATFDQVTLSPKSLGTYSEVSKQLLAQGSMDVEGLIRDDMVKVLAIAEDLAAISGTGTEQPTGITGQTNVADVAATASPYTDVVNMEKEVAVDNALSGSLSYIAGAGVIAKMKVTEIATNTARFIYENGMVNGYPMHLSNQVPAPSTATVIFGNWSDLLIGHWQGVDITIDPYSKAEYRLVKLVVAIWADIAVRHGQSFSKCDDYVIA